MFIDSLFSLKNKTAIITGAAGYFGSAFSEAILLAGAKVILFGRGDNVKVLTGELKKKYGDDKVDFFQVDFYNEIEYSKCLFEAIRLNKNIDILVNNVFDFSKETGFNDESGKLENISKSQWMKSFESGVYWHSLAIQIVAEKMKRQKCGSIINVSSMYALISPDPKLYEGTEIFNPPSYGSVKSALLAFTRYVASFYGKYNIRCNALVPGSFPNVNIDSYNGVKDEKFLEKLSNKTVLGRVGKLDDLLAPLIFLAADSSSYITGQNIIVDGGWTIK